MTTRRQLYSLTCQIIIALPCNDDTRQYSVDAFSSLQTSSVETADVRDDTFPSRRRDRHVNSVVLLTTACHDDVPRIEPPGNQSNPRRRALPPGSASPFCYRRLFARARLLHRTPATAAQRRHCNRCCASIATRSLR